ncbi:MAG: hypothetical protein AAFP19_15650, partial [Bacteroidota bacterium]
MQQLGEIQADLLRGQTDTFQKRIVSPAKDELYEWLIGEYPALEEEAQDILMDVFSKLQQLIKRWEPEKGGLDVDKELRLLTKKECKLAEPTNENRQKNLGLTRAEFKALRQQLKLGEETLIEQAYLSHFKQCLNFLVFRESAEQEVAYNCTMDALYEIRKDLLKGRIFYGNLAYYFTYRAKKKLYKYRIQQKEPTLSLSGLDFEDEEKTEADLVQKELAALVSTAIQQLCRDCQLIIKSFYYDDQSLKEIAEK